MRAIEPPGTPLHGEGPQGRERATADHADGRRKGKRKPRGITLIPFFGDLVAMSRLLRDRGSPAWAKVLALLAILYVVLPFDVVTDFAPVVGWLDDVGLVV